MAHAGFPNGFGITEEEIIEGLGKGCKGGTFDAVLLLSSPDGRGKTGFGENWLKSDKESGRIGYVASTRPRYLFCWGVSNLMDDQRQKLEGIGCIKLDR